MIPLGVLAGSARGGWSPLNIASLEAWWDASDAGSITASAGRVSQWNDKSGNGYHATQTIEPQRPTTGVGSINGLNALRFAVVSGTGNALVSSVSSSMPEVTVAAVINRFAQGQTYPTVTCGSVSGSFQTGLDRYGDDSGIQQSSARTNVAWIVRSASGKAAGVARQWMWTFSDSANVGTLRADRAANGSAAHGGSLATGATTIIGYNYSSSGWLQGDIGELIMCSSVLTGTDLTDLETYLTDKWGIA